jgi:hypothetical protein
VTTNRVLGELDIVSVWSILGGGPLRAKRGQAFWRNGNGYNVALEPAKGTWFDYRDSRGGGVLALVETALGCSRSDGLRWLEENCGLDSRRLFSQEERTEQVKKIAERTKAESWGIAARALAEQALDKLDENDAGRADYTRLLGIISTGGPALIKEYRTWRDIHPELTQAMVRAGMSSHARVQRRLALCLLELANAA